MRLVIQRVSSASVAVQGKTIGSIGQGLLLFVGVGSEDRSSETRRMAEKVARLRVFSDANGKMNLSVRDVGGEIMLVSQFTLYADVTKGNRPSFVAAAKPEEAGRVLEELSDALSEEGLSVTQGKFGAHMEVSLTNDGPVTIVLSDP